LTVIADASPDDDDLVRTLGADQVVARGDRVTDRIRALVPAGVPGLIDPANLDAVAMAAIADGGTLVTVKGWSGPGERGITVHPVSAFDSFTNTALLERLRDLAEDGTLSLRVADVMPARDAARAHQLLAAGGVRGRLVLDFEAPLSSSHASLIGPGMLRG
jgi:NADPH2:quinone reductase